MSRLRRALPLLLVAAIAAGLRLWQIDSIPPGFHFDESFEGLEAWRILTDPGYKPIFLTGNFGVPPLNAYANAVMFGLFQLFGGEAGPTAMRTTAALFGLLGVLAVYALARELRRHDPRLPATFPFLAAAALAVMRWHIHFSRIGIEPILVPAIWAGSTWLLLRGWRTGNWSSWLGGGGLLAAGMYAYYGAWIIPLLVLPVFGHVALSDRENIRKRLPALLLAAVVAALLVLPLALFFRQHPDLFILRAAQIAVVGGGEGATQTSPLANAWASLKMFWPFAQTGDLAPRRNLPGAPALNLWLALPFFLGAALTLARIRRPSHSLLLIGLVGLLLPGVVSEYAPHFHRVLGASAPAALLAGLGLAETGKWLGNRLTIGRAGWAWIGLIFILLGGVTSAQNYFGRWASLPDLFYAFDAGLWQNEQWMRHQPADSTLFLTSRDRTHPTLAFAWELDHRAPPTSFDGRSIFPFSTDASGDERYLVIEHEDFRTRLLLPDIFPDAEISEELLDGWGQVYSRVYTRRAGSAPQRRPQQALDIALGDGIRLQGYDTNPAQPTPGGILYLQLYWQAEAIPQQNWTVFTHLLGTNGAVLAGRDSIPGGGSLPTPRWQAGWTILDEYQIALPADLPPGEYTLEAGLYQPGGESMGALLGAVNIGP